MDTLAFETDKAKFYCNSNTKLIDRDLEQLNEYFKCYKAVTKDDVNYVIVDHELGCVKFSGDSGWSSVLNYLSFLKYERSDDE